MFNDKIRSSEGVCQFVATQQRTELPVSELRPTAGQSFEPEDFEELVSYSLIMNRLENPSPDA